MTLLEHLLYEDLQRFMDFSDELEHSQPTALFSPLENAPEAEERWAASHLLIHFLEARVPFDPLWTVKKSDSCSSNMVKKTPS